VPGVNAFAAFVPTFDPELFDSEGVHEEARNEMSCSAGGLIIAANYLGVAESRAMRKRDGIPRQRGSSRGRAAKSRQRFISTDIRSGTSSRASSVRMRDEAIHV